MNREPMAHRPEDWMASPQVTAADWRALFWLIAFAVVFVAICAVEQ